MSAAGPESVGPETVSTEPLEHSQELIDEAKGAAREALPESSAAEDLGAPAPDTDEDTGGDVSRLR